MQNIYYAYTYISPGTYEFCRFVALNLKYVNAQCNLAKGTTLVLKFHYLSHLAKPENNLTLTLILIANKPYIYLSASSIIFVNFLFPKTQIITQFAKIS